MLSTSFQSAYEDLDDPDLETSGRTETAAETEAPAAAGTATEADPAPAADSAEAVPDTASEPAPDEGAIGAGGPARAEPEAAESEGFDAAHVFAVGTGFNPRAGVSLRDIMKVASAASGHEVTNLGMASRAEMYRGIVQSRMPGVLEGVTKENYKERFEAFRESHGDRIAMETLASPAAETPGMEDDQDVPSATPREEPDVAPAVEVDTSALRRTDAIEEPANPAEPVDPDTPPVDAAENAEVTSGEDPDVDMPAADNTAAEGPAEEPSRGETGKAQDDVSPEDGDLSEEVEPETGSASESDDPYIPPVHPDFMKTPAGAPIALSYEERRMEHIQGGESAGTVSPIPLADLEKQNEEALAVHQDRPKDPGKPDCDEFPWIKKPAPWPKFIDFPSKRDLEAIRAADAAGALTPDRRDKFNEHFEKLAKLMKQRAEQIDEWIVRENEPFKSRERKLPWKSTVARNLRETEKARYKAARDAGIPRKDAKIEGIVTDPFYDIKWAALLNPYKSPDDPMFSTVARWGHNTAVTHDGGHVVASDDGMRCAFGTTPTPMAAQLMIQEALERGWEAVDISGSRDFCEAAKKAVVEAGLGARIEVNDGLLGKKKEFIMPRPPKLHGKQNEQDVTREAHQELTSGEGKAPEGSRQDPGAHDLVDKTDAGPQKAAPPSAGQGKRRLSTPGVRTPVPESAPGAGSAPRAATPADGRAPAPDVAVDVDEPFGEDERDAAFDRRQREAGAEEPNPA